MNNAYLPGYRKKKIPELLRAIDDCTSLSQLFALIQHEQIEIQMRAQSGASNLQPRKLTAKEIIANNDLPLDRLKAEVKRSVCGSYVPPKLTQAEGELIQAIRDTRTLSELFTLIQRGCKAGCLLLCRRIGNIDRVIHFPRGLQRFHRSWEKTPHDRSD